MAGPAGMSWAALPQTGLHGWMESAGSASSLSACSVASHLDHCSIRRGGFSCPGVPANLQVRTVRLVMAALVTVTFATPPTVGYAKCAGRGSCRESAPQLAHLKVQLHPRARRLLLNALRTS